MAAHARQRSDLSLERRGFRIRALRGSRSRNPHDLYCLRTLGGDFRNRVGSPRLGHRGLCRGSHPAAVRARLCTAQARRLECSRDQILLGSVRGGTRFIFCSDPIYARRGDDPVEWESRIDGESRRGPGRPNVACAARKRTARDSSWQVTSGCLLFDRSWSACHGEVAPAWSAA